MSASLLIVFAAAGLQWGCQRQPTQQTALESAFQKIDQANQGYVPGGASSAGNKPSSPSDIQAYRQTVLAQAGKDLDQAIGRGSNQDLKVAASRLRARIDRSAARYASLQAAHAYAQLAPQSVEMVSYVLAGNRAAAQGQALGHSQPDLIAKIQEQINKQRSQQKTLEQQSRKLTAQLHEQQAQLASLQKAHDAAMAKSQELQGRAFVASGDQQYQLLDQAAAAQREGSKAVAQRERIQIKVDTLQSQLTVVNSQLKLLNTLNAKLRDRLKAAQTRQEQIKKGVQQAGQHQDEVVKKLTDEFAKVTRTYHASVDKPLDAAGSRMALAVDHLQGALKQATPASRQDLRLDLLAAYVGQARILVDHLQTARDFAQTVTLLVQGVKNLAPDQVQLFQQALDQLQKSQQALAKKAQDAIQAGQALIKQMGNVGGDAAKVVQDQTRRLASYQQAIQVAQAK